jgi:hypothetical protein
MDKLTCGITMFVAILGLGSCDVRHSNYIQGILADWLGSGAIKKKSSLGMHYISATAAFYHSTWLRSAQIHPKWVA